MRFFNYMVASRDMSKALPSLELCCFSKKHSPEGEVVVFEIYGHAQAKRAYAGSYRDGNNTRCAVVVEIPPITSPRTAFEATMATDRQQNLPLSRTLRIQIARTTMSFRNNHWMSVEQTLGTGRQRSEIRIAKSRVIRQGTS